MQAKQMQAVADETGMIQQQELDVNVNIRDDDVTLFETKSGRQLFRTPEMTEEVYIEPVPTEEGFVAEVVVNPTVELEVVDSAAVSETTVAQSPEIRMD